jgi:hypothetical protein
VWNQKASLAHQIVIAAQIMIAEWLSFQNLQQSSRETVSRMDTVSGTAVHCMICNVDIS